MKISNDHIYQWLQDVKDPEIPVLSLSDMGIIKDVQIHDEGRVTITITPTFVGCPAIEMMKSEIIDTLRANGVSSAEVLVSYKIPWSSDDITERGREALTRYGLAPPPQSNLFTDLSILEHAECPRCKGRNTEMKTPFGPTLCRSIHYCIDCREAFEQFKPV